MNRAICKAIKKKAVIQFRYHDSLRTVESQRHGISTAGKEVMRGLQTSGGGRSGQSHAEKLFEVSKISDLKETGETFAKPDFILILTTKQWLMCTVACIKIKTRGQCRQIDEKTM